MQRFIKINYSTHAAVKKTTLEAIGNLYKKNIPITVITATDYPSATFAEKSGVDVVLVGDSLAMVTLGHANTLEIELEEMIIFSKAVSRGATSSLLIGDLPFGSYESSSKKAIKSAIKFIKYGKVDAVKLEGGAEMAETISKMTECGIPVMGHIGLTPQRATSLSGFKAQGRTLEKAKSLLKDALALQKAGCFSIVLEAVPEDVADLITKQLSIPTIGIGSGSNCSGQVLVMNDLLGVYDKLSPKFAKVYCNIGELATKALQNYCQEVRSRTFPVSVINTFKMLPGEDQLFKEWVETIKK